MAGPSIAPALPAVKLQPQLAMAPKLAAPSLKSKPSPAPVMTAPRNPTPPVAGAPQLSTSKVWVLPPRPKPGRKPSTDTPPTKRKAQNRAAQRAFRERRAQRVSELEEMLSDVTAERDQRERNLTEKLSLLSKENSELRKEMELLRNDIMAIKSRRNSRADYGYSGQSGGYQMTQMVSPAPSMESPMDLLDRALELRHPSQPKDDEDCGVCSKDDCICETIGIKQPRSLVSSPKGSTMFHIPDYTAPVPLKRRRTQSGSNMNPFRKLNSLETDFTKTFAREDKSLEESAPKRLRLSATEEQCGFCEPGTPCVCAEKTLAPLIMRRPSDLSPNSSRHNSRLPSLSSEYRALASPISIVPVDQQYMPEKPTEGGCTGDPGNCSQCKTDPMSTLFCTTLASRVYASRSVKSSRHSAIAEEKTEAKSGCCGGSGKAGCCKDTAGDKKALASIILPPGTPSTTTPSGTFIPCSAAYQTLSRHKDFKRVDLGKLVGKLNTRGMQVEVSSVANVLRELDRRFDQ